MRKVVFPNSSVLSSPRRRPGSRFRCGLDSGLRRNDGTEKCGKPTGRKASSWEIWVLVLASLSLTNGFCAMDYQAMERAAVTSPSRIGIEEVLRILPNNPQKAIEGLAEGIHLSGDPAAIFVMWQIADYHDDPTYRSMALNALDAELKIRIESLQIPFSPFITALGHVALLNPDQETRAHATKILASYLDAKKLNPKLGKKVVAVVEAHFWPAADKLLVEFNQNNMDPVRDLIEILRQKVPYFQSACSTQKLLSCTELPRWLEQAEKIAYPDDGC